MDFEATLKVMTAVTGAAGSIGLVKLVYDWSLSRRGRLREHYNFARDFLDQLNAHPTMHPYLVEAGFQAVAGTRNITAAEARHIMSLEPAITLEDYVFSRSVLEVADVVGRPTLLFRKPYINDRKRRWKRMSYAGLYFLFALAAPLLLAASALGALRGAWPLDRTALNLSLSACILWPLAYAALMTSAKISRAEALVARALAKGGLPVEMLRVQQEDSAEASG